MRGYYLLLKSHSFPVIFGWILTFFSSLGQTFLISLFVPFLLIELQLSKGLFGVYYALATLIASGLLLKFGPNMDRKAVRPQVNSTIWLLALSSGLLAATVHPGMLFLSLVGLRYGGHCMMSHISQTVVSRYFDENRGKALSFTSLGYSMGEMVFPLLMGGIMAMGSWRTASIVGALLLLAMLPVLGRMDLESLNPSVTPDSTQIVTHEKTNFYKKIVAEGRFWIIAPSVFVLSFVTTGLFFYQYVLAGQRGWPLELYTLFFAAYAGVRLLFSIYGGLLTDRHSAISLFPWYLIPFFFGTLAIAILPGLSAAAVFLTMTGISMGLAGVIKTAILAETYDIGNLGRVRSIFATVTVVSTATAPLIYGIVLDISGFDALATGSAALLGLATLNAFRIKRR